MNGKNYFKAFSAFFVLILLASGCQSVEERGHIHTLTKIPESPATCKDKGNEEYYECSGCGKLFKNEHGTQEITNKISIEIPIDSSNHNYGTDGTCTRCGKLSATVDGIVYAYKIDDEGNGAYEVSDVTYKEIAKANIKSEIGGIPVKRINNSAFSGCSSLTSVTIPDSVTSIGSNAFSGCSNLTSITIPDNVTSISPGTFYNCSSLTSITIPDSVTSIGDGTFSNCRNVETLVIGKGVASIGEGAFAGCTSLTSLAVSENNETYKSNENCIYTKDGKELVQAASDLTSVTIPDSITSIGAGAFSGCRNVETLVIGNGITSLANLPITSALKSITIGNGVTSIDYSAFSGCSSLTSITIPDSVTSIGSNAFSGCSKLASITIGNGVTSIDNHAFSGCSNLTSITIPDSVTKIGKNAFYNCSSLTSITIPDNVTSIGSNAFYNCSSLISVIIPESVKSIGNSAFANCTELTSITLPFVGASKNGTTATYLGYIFGASTHHENKDYVPESLKHVTIAGGNSIGDHAFYGCKNITNITIPASVTEIGKSAFGNALIGSGFSSVTYTGELKDWCAIKGLESLMVYTASDKTLTIGGKEITGDLIIPDGVTCIEDYAFYHFSGFTSITLPDSLEYIGAWSFCKCTGVSSITFKGTQDQWKTMTRGSWWDNKAGDGYGFLKVFCIDGTLVKTNIVN